MTNFCTTTYGKWILSGEHAVLRHHPAIVFPLGNYALNFKYTSHDSPLRILGDTSNHALIAKVWQLAWQLLQTAAPGGTISLNSSIPVGQGMGASAALCLAVARTVCAIANVTTNIFALAKALEHNFHHESSGLDIIGSGSKTGNIFHNGTAAAINLTWQPNWLLTPTSLQGSTTKAVAKVQKMHQTHPQHAQAIDRQMARSVQECLEALEEISLTKLATGMRLANECFAQWGLITPLMQTAINNLYARGALAVKPTGSGGGGFLLSLWPQQPAAICAQEIIITLPACKTSHLL